MSTTIEQRVVEMQFDNKLFEKNVSTSMSTLDKLNKSLKLTEGAKGLENIGSAAKKVDMSGLGNAVETVATKFSSLQVMAVTALANITNSAVNAGKRVVSALTVEPVMTGFNEYETKINAIQTIMSNTASKGTTMDDVTRVIGDLNTYADKTIYNFAEMTRNIGTFTAAGVGLEESASAIKGIANLAAASGSSSQQASTAMYQLSQALSTGTVRLMDWNSVVNAGMGGEKFQEALKATAREHGIAVDDIIKKSGSFRDSLSEEWLSAEILNETLNKFTVDGAKKYAKSMMESGEWTQKQADALIKEAQSMEDAATKVKTFTQLWDTLKESAQSGWSQTWEIIIGDFEEAKETLTKFSDTIGGMIGASADARNKLLQGWKDAGGRADLLDSLYNVFNGVLEVIKPIKEAMNEIFPPLTVKQLVNFTKNLKELTAKFKIGSETADKLKRTFKGVFALLDIGIQIVKGLFSGFGELLKRLAPTGSGILSFTASLGDGIVKFRDFLKESETFTKFFKGIGKVLGTGIDWIRRFISGIVDLCKSIANIDTSGIEKFGDKVKERFKPLTLLFEGVKKIFVGMANIIKKVAPTFAAVAGKIGEGFRGISEGIAKGINESDWSTLFDIFNGGLIASILISVKKFMSNIASFTDEGKGFFDGLKSSLGQIKDAILDTFGAIQTQLKAGALLKIAGAIAILAASLIAISFIDSEKLTKSLTAIAVLFGELFGAFAVFNKIFDSKNLNSMRKVSTTMIGMSIAVLILAGAMTKIATLDWNGVAKGLVGVGALLGMLVAVVYSLKDTSGKLGKISIGLMLFGAALHILANAVIKLSELEWEGLAKGLLSIGVLSGLLVGITKALSSYSGKLAKCATGLILMGAAISILVKAVINLSGLSWENLTKGLLGVVAISGILVGVVKALSNNSSKMMSTAIGLTILATSMKIFASVIGDLGNMSWEGMIKGLLGLGVSLGVLVGALRAMPKNTVGMGIGLIAIASAITILSNSLKSMGGMSWEEIAKGLVTLGVSLGIVAGGMHAMKNAVAGAGAMLVMSVALAMFTPQLKALGSMSMKEIGLGLIALAGAFTVLGLASKILKPIIPTMVKLAAAMAVFGVAVALVGAGVLALSIGLTGLAGAASSIAVAIVTILSSVISLIPYFFEQLGAGIVAFCKVISDGIPAIGEAIKAIVFTIIDVLVECIPLIVDGILKLISEVLTGLVKYIPTIVDLVFQFIVGIIDGLARNIPTLIQSLVDLMMSVFQGVIDALKTIDPEVLAQGVMGIGVLAGIMAALAAVSGLIPAAMIGVVGMGLVIAELAFVLAAIGALAQIDGLTWMINEGAPLLQGIGTAIGSFVGGIVGGFSKGVTSALPDIASDLSEFMGNVQPFIEGAKLIDTSVLNGIKALAEVILVLTGASILEGMTSWITGGSSITKFANELVPLGKGIKAFSDEVSGISTAPILAAAMATKALAEMTSHIPNEGGVAAWFAGENSIAKFGSEIVELGKGIKGFSVAVEGANPETIITAANAAKAIAEMTSIIPNEGGVAAWFAGENSISKFGTDIVELGKGIKGFSVAVEGANPSAIVAAANAAKSIAEMTAIIPNEGGVASWFAGENSISKFGEDIIALGKGIKGFAVETEGLNSESVLVAVAAAQAIADMTSTIPNEGGVVSWFAGDNSISKFGEDIIALGKGIKGFGIEVAGLDVTSVMTAVMAASHIAQMTSIIPNSGGVVSWFAGDNSISKFATDLVMLGRGLKGFGTEVSGIAPETIIAASRAAQALAIMTSYIPNSGGVVSWFTGDSSISKFGTDIVSLGKGLKGFSTEVAGIAPENVISAANAAKSLAEMTSYIPNSGGVVSWFTGEASISKFGGELTALGKGLKGFSDEVTDISPENMTAAAQAGKAIAEMTNIIPTEGGIKAWFAGDTNIADYAESLPELGKGLKGFSDEVTDINSESVTAAASAAKSLGEMVKVIPTEGGIKAWFAGETNVADFADKLPDLGKGLKGFSDELEGINTANITAGASAAKDLAEMTKTTPKNTDKLIDFGDNLVTFGGKLSSYFKKVSEISIKTITASEKAISAVKESVSGFNSGDFTKASKAIDALVKSIKGMAGVTEKTTSGFVNALKKVAKLSVTALLKEFKDAGPKMVESGKKMLEQFIKGLESKSKSAKSTFKKIVTSCAEAIGSVTSKFKSAAKDLVKGFANGISSYTYLAEAKSRAMAKAAADAAREELDEHSPSKVGYEIGDFFGFAFVDSIGGYIKKAYNVSSKMAESARLGMSNAISKVVDVINSDVDMQPTIRPVLDLSDVKAGTGALNNMLDVGSSVGVLARVGSIGSMMNQRVQNGNGDVVSAIEKLGKALGNMSGDTYNVNGVTYDDGSNISNAVKTIVRAGRIARRV